MVKKLISKLMFEDDIKLEKNKTASFGSKTFNSCSTVQDDDFDYKYSNDNLYYKSEIALWKAVILQALLDLQTTSKKKIANTYRVKALMWFNLKNEEFLTVYNYAGLDPLYVYTKSQNVKRNNRFFN